MENAENKIEKFQEELKSFGIVLNEEKLNQFLLYYDMLIEWNNFVNLTAITDFEEVLKKHFVDSVSLIKAIPDLSEKNYRLIDIGTGAGFPGIPLKIVFPNLEINISNYTVEYYGESIDFPPKEFELLHYLAENPNQVFTREQLLDRIWGYEYIGDTRTVDVHIKRIREKLNKHEESWSIKTVWGVGYKFELK